MPFYLYTFNNKKTFGSSQTCTVKRRRLVNKQKSEKEEQKSEKEEQD